jgi:formamidopyrimidine-DNA glycosylase
MPELPEVETTKRALAPWVTHQVIADAVIRQPKLRWPIPADLAAQLSGQTIQQVSRRAKYIIWQLDQGHLLWHLGMSGHIHILTTPAPPQKHDHVDILMNSGLCVRLRDPRRFGALLYSPTLEQHPLLAHLGPEPLSDAFHIDYLMPVLTKRHQAIKSLLMDSKLVVGIGNIYANEALFIAGIHPQRAGNSLTRAAGRQLIQACQQVLTAAIEAGGTTLKDFISADGKPGYFRQCLRVYGRAQQPCYRCGAPIHKITLAQRSTFFCANCQK